MPRASSRLDRRGARRASAPTWCCFPSWRCRGYPPEDLLLRPGFLRRLRRRRWQTIARRRCTASSPWSAGRRRPAVVYNAASVLRDGVHRSTYRKRELPNYAVFDERRYFDVDPDGDACVFDVEACTVGLVICEDLWFAEPLAETARAGAQLVRGAECLAVRARQARAARCAAGAARARDRTCALAYLNVVGGQDDAGVRWRLGAGRRRWHRASGARAFEDHWLVVDFDAATRKFTRGAAGREDERRGRERWPGARMVRGTRDYCARTVSRRCWLGLSGGVDSALVLALAVDALGAGQRHRRAPAVALHRRPEQRPGRRTGARAWACSIETVPIEAPFQGFLEALAPVFAGRAADVTEENLQSRSRGVILMALSQQVRRPGADHRQQERVRGRLRDDLRRHVRRLRADQGPVQDRGLRAVPLAQYAWAARR